MKETPTESLARDNALLTDERVLTALLEVFYSTICGDMFLDTELYADSVVLLSDDEITFAHYRELLEAAITDYHVANDLADLTYLLSLKCTDGVYAATSIFVSLRNTLYTEMAVVDKVVETAGRLMDGLNIQLLLEREGTSFSFTETLFRNAAELFKLYNSKAENIEYTTTDISSIKTIDIPPIWNGVEHRSKDDLYALTDSLMHLNDYDYASTILHALLHIDEPSELRDRINEIKTIDGAVLTEYPSNIEAFSYMALSLSDLSSKPPASGIRLLKFFESVRDNPYLWWYVSNLGILKISWSGALLHTTRASEYSYLSGIAPLPPAAKEPAIIVRAVAINDKLSTYRAIIEYIVFNTLGLYLFEESLKLQPDVHELTMFRKVALTLTQRSTLNTESLRFGMYLSSDSIIGSTCIYPHTNDIRGVMDKVIFELENN